MPGTKGAPDDQAALREECEALRTRLRVAEQRLETMVQAAAEHEVGDSRQLLRAVVDGAQDAIMLTDDAGTYVDVNAAACRIFGLPRAELVGRSFADFADPDLDAQAALQELRDRGRMAGLFPIRLLDGTRRTLEFTAVANVVPGQHLSILRDVTDRIAAQEALRRNEALFRAVIEKSSEVISLTTSDGSTRYLTPSAWRILGWDPAEQGGRTLREQVVPEDRARIVVELERLARTGDRDWATELRVMHRDGSIRWVESTATNLLDDPDVQAIVGNYRDITARKLADGALRASRDQLEEAQRLAHLGNWSVGLGPDDEIAWSTECYRIFGLPVGTVVTKAIFFERLDPADRERMQRGILSMLAHDQPYDLEHRVQRPDGAVRWVHSRAVVERDAAGQPTRMIGTVHDVTDRHDAIETLRASEEQYRRIVENTAEGVWRYDPEGITTFMNARMAEMLGYTVEEALGQSVLAFMDDSHHAAAHQRAERRRRGIAERADFRLRRKDGSELLVSVQANPMYDADGRYEGALALVMDVSAERRAQQARAHLAAIVESSDDAIISVNRDGTITSWNLGAETLYQHRAAEVVGSSIRQLVPPERQAEEARTLERVARGESVGTYETERICKDGTVVPVALTLSPIRDAGGVVIGVSKIARDLTARRRAEAAHRRTEEQFRQAQKMEAVGRLAGGIAHDFNNLLSVILSYAQFAIEDLKPGDPLRDDMLEIDQAGRRATELTMQLLAFSRQQILMPQVIDLAQVVSAMERMLRRLLGEDVTLALLIDQGGGRVLADPGQIEQIVMNLAVNARDAMPGGGELTIELSDVHVGHEDSASGARPGDYVMLAVTDTGVGMDAATRQRAFEPFYTTKEQGKGTGLGLSTVFGIVQQSGGFVGIYSEPGHGTTFKIYLPRTDQVADVARAERKAMAQGGTETILLVEDEDQVRAVACAILRRNGYHVLETSNGGEALLVSRNFGAKIHLMLTDVVMPRMSGRKLAEELGPLRPDMKVVYASGYTDDAIIQHGVLDAGVFFVQKPFTPDALLRKVREALDARSLA